MSDPHRSTHCKHSKRSAYIHDMDSFYHRNAGEVLPNTAVTTAAGGVPVILVIWVYPSGTLVLGNLQSESLDLSGKITIWRCVWHNFCCCHGAYCHKCDGPRVLPSRSHVTPGNSGSTIDFTIIALRSSTALGELFDDLIRSPG